MDSNTYSMPVPAGLGLLTAAVDDLAAQDLTRLPDGEAARRVLVLRRLVDRLEGQWLRELAGVDGRGAAGVEHDTHADSTAGWLRGRLRAGHRQASSWVRTARALFRGPLAGTGRALAAGELSPGHAAVLAAGTVDLPPGTAAEAEPVLLEVAGRLDPPGLRRVLGHLHDVADPEGAEARVQHQHQRRADALAELARRALEGGRLPQTGGVRPQVTVTVELAGLLGHPGLPGADGGWVGPLPVETVRRLACDAAVTRVLVARHPLEAADGGDGHRHATRDDEAAGDLPRRLRAAIALLPPVLGGAPREPLEVGRATRVVSPAQRTALAVRDGGCVVSGCDRPPAWCEAHHLRHWLRGGPTDLENLVLLCRAHHRAVHEGHQHLHRRPTAA
jgi:Domain of unknown function (DUF222)/HNH endonuclease